MKKFQQLIIRHPHDELVALLDTLKSDKGLFAYKRNKSTEYAKNIFHTEETAACFATERKSLAKASVWLVITNNELRVANITPDGVGSLGIVMYNTILNAFFHNYLARYLDDSWSNSVYITGENVSMEELVGSETFKALQRWEHACNHTSPITNESDRRLWFEFVRLLYREGKSLDLEDFSEWLSEDCGWPSCLNDVIIDLELKLEYSLDLLKHCDGTI